MQLKNGGAIIPKLTCVKCGRLSPSNAVMIVVMTMIIMTVLLRNVYPDEDHDDDDDYDSDDGGGGSGVGDADDDASRHVCILDGDVNAFSKCLSR